MTTPHDTPVTGGTRISPPVAGLDLLTHSERDADGILLTMVVRLAALGVAHGVTAATHWARAGEVRHVALSVELPGMAAHVAWPLLESLLPPGDPAYQAICLGDRRSGTPALCDAAAAAAAAHTLRASGRAVVFPGSDLLTDTVTVRRLLDRSSIDRVSVLGGGDADPESTLNTRGFLRPRWIEGQLVLHLQPALGGTFVPFESPNPTPCCADHT